MSLPLGAKAPRVELEDERGKTVALPNDGHPLVLVFFRGDW